MSEEKNKNPLIESFLRLHRSKINEVTGTVPVSIKPKTQQQNSPMPQSGMTNSSWFSGQSDMQRATQDLSKMSKLRSMQTNTPALDSSRDASLDKPGLEKAGVEKALQDPEASKVLNQTTKDAAAFAVPAALTGGPIGNMIGRGAGALVSKGYNYLKGATAGASAGAKAATTAATKADDVVSAATKADTAAPSAASTATTGATKSSNVVDDLARQAGAKTQADAAKFRAKPGISAEKAGERLAAGERAQDVGNATRSTVRTTINPKNASAAENIASAGTKADNVASAGAKTADTAASGPKPATGAATGAATNAAVTGSTKALGGFGKVPSLGKGIAAGAGIAAAGAALTGGSTPAGDANAETAAKQPEKYKIAKGDNLSTLAQKWGVSVGDIMKHNQGIKDPNKIYAGAELVRPEKTGNPIYKDNIGTKSGPKKSQNIQKEENEMSNPLISAFMKLQDMKSGNIFEAAKKVKKLDPVGKEDDDVDNDGKVDSSDKYLKNRREKIAKAMKEAKDPYGENDGGVYTSPPRPTTDEEKPKLKPSEVKTDTKKKETTVYKQQSEEIEQIDELKAATLRSYRDAANWDVRGIRSGDESNDDFDRDAMMKRRRKGAVMSAKKLRGTAKVNAKEEVEFSEEELAHIASILEGPVAPTSQDSNTSFGKGASRTGTLTDETNLKKKLKEEAEELEEAKRGRKPGVKVGAYGPRGAKKGESGEGGAVAGNPAIPHPFHQIRSQRPDSEGNYTVQHDTGSGIISAKVPAGHAAKFHNSYLATEKPRDKEALTHDFVQSAFKLEAPKAKSGISLPKMPSPKS